MTSYNSVTMRNVMKIIRKVAPTSADVVLIGEFGTDKQQVAEKIHQWSKGDKNPLHEIDCTFLDNGESILNYLEYPTGGNRQFKAENYGRGGGQEILYLKHYHELPEKVRRSILSNHYKQPVYDADSSSGGPAGKRLILDIKPEYFNDLIELLNRYQLHPVLLYVPALRERLEDLEAISREVIETCAITHNQPSMKIAPYIYLRLLSYRWPGNIIQLRHVIIEAMILALNSNMTLSDLPESIPRDIDRLWTDGTHYQNDSYWRAVGGLIRKVNRESRNIGEVARKLKCNTETAIRLLQNGYDIDRKVFSDNLEDAFPNGVVFNGNTFNV